MTSLSHGGCQVKIAGCHFCAKMIFTRFQRSNEWDHRIYLRILLLSARKVLSQREREYLITLFFSLQLAQFHLFCAASTHCLERLLQLTCLLITGAHETNEKGMLIINHIAFWPIAIKITIGSHSEAHIALIHNDERSAQKGSGKLRMMEHQLE